MTQEGLVSAKDIASKFFDKSKSQSGSSLTLCIRRRECWTDKTKSKSS